MQFQEWKLKKFLWKLLSSLRCNSTEIGMTSLMLFNTLRPRQNGCHFADDTFKCIFFTESIRIWIKISLKFVLRVPINNILALVSLMAGRRPGDKLLFEPMMVRLWTHICVTRPQWVNVMWSCMMIHFVAFAGFHQAIFITTKQWSMYTALGQQPLNKSYHQS